MTNLTQIRAAQRVTGRFQVELTCRRCGVAFVPSAEAVRAGPQVYRYCPQCRPSANAGEQEPEVLA